METILFIAHTESDAALAKSACEAMTAAKELAAALGAPLLVGLIGERAQPAADALANCGAQRMLAVEGADFAQPRYATDAAAIAALCAAASATLIVAPGTSRMNRVLPGAAARLGGAADLHATKIEGASITRWYYRQRMEAVQSRQQRPWLIGVDPGTHPAWTGEAGAATIERVAADLSDAQRRTVVQGVQSPSSGAQTIRPEAKLLFVAGAGWTKKQADGQTHIDDAQSIILGFLNATQASLGGSKSIVDLSGEGQAVLPFMTHLNQVGQTGSTPRHPKGLSTCCHGEEPHVVGWRFINERRAISLDPNCGWAHGKADVLYVADAFEVMRAVNALLQ
ncbi:MAG TPA: electron transfer flavoprotein subunit alpha [Candidatus Hydrogenedentes bacterium]|nr:electron transfer flavoprotein subunit alpha [Candidatus Hydrogenedentota bacterium]HOS03886.1 electron transfer flavoprotein subunit alpha [Candidatus Hydrogenedentota bacterium]